MHSGAMVFISWSQENKSSTRVDSLTVVCGSEWFALTWGDDHGGEMKLMFPNINITEMKDSIGRFSKKDFILA